MLRRRRFLIARCLGWSAWLLVAAQAVGAAEPEIAGVFADDGAVVARPAGGIPGVVSLRALLALQFDPLLASALHDQTAEVRVSHGAGVVGFQAVDHEGVVVWQSDWRLSTGYTQRGERVILRLHPERSGRDDYLIILEAVTPHRLLQVEVQRLSPTLLGPTFTTLGTFVFPRLK